jgi:hypothetical protein
MVLMWLVSRRRIVTALIYIELEQGHSQQNVQASVMLKKSW